MQSPASPDLRTDIAGVLAGAVPLVNQGITVVDFVEAVLACSQEEGVSALLCLRLQEWGRSASLPVPLQTFVQGLAAPLQAHVRGLAAAELLQRIELRRVLQALAHAGIPVLVLKGHALSQWLYPEPHLRECCDMDLLFASRGQAEQAVAALEGLGYAMVYRPSGHAHELLCRRPGSPSDLDMHWALTSFPVLDRMPGFDTLHADAIALTGLGASARGLSPVHAMLHACVHRASNLCAGPGDRLKWLYDIHLLAASFTSPEWKGFVTACRDARISGMAASGLMASQAMFGTPLPAVPMQQLSGDACSDALDATRLSDWRYVQRCNLASLSGFSAKTAWLWNRAFPPAGYMREFSGSQQGWPGLMWRRFLRLMARLRSRRDQAAG